MQRSGGGVVREMLHRIGTLEVHTAELKVKQTALDETTDDHEVRLRKLEYLTAKVVGGAILGSALGSWILSNLGSCVK